MAEDTEKAVKTASVCVTLGGFGTDDASALAFGGANEQLAGVPTSALVAELAARSSDTSLRVLDGVAYVNAALEM